MEFILLSLKNIFTVLSASLVFLFSSFSVSKTPVMKETANKSAYQENAAKKPDILLTNSIVSPTVTPTITTIPDSHYLNPKVSPEPKIDCTGPDGKHLQITQKECEDFNNAWKGIKPSPALDTNGWGVAQQISEHTWTMKIGQDNQMGTPQEIFLALNNYRQVQNKPQLSWNDNLAAFAQKRAEDQAKLGRTDEHAGFDSYVQNPSNLKNLGFWSVGENSSSGYILSGVHLIEWIFASDKPHNDNQLNPNWTNIGVGVSKTIVDIVFGGNN